MIVFLDGSFNINVGFVHDCVFTHKQAEASNANVRLICFSRTIKYISYNAFATALQWNYEYRGNQTGNKTLVRLNKKFDTIDVFLLRNPPPTGNIRLTII